MEEVTQYSRYQQPLKKMCIVQIIFSLMTVLTIVCLVFLPNFKMAINSEVMQANITLPKLYDAEIWAQILTQANPEINFLGCIYINYQRAQKQAIEIGNTFEREMCFLFVHGLLHLLGYDHIKKEDEDIMFSLQRKIFEGEKLW